MFTPCTPENERGYTEQECEKPNLKILPESFFIIIIIIKSSYLFFKREKVSDIVFCFLFCVCVRGLSHQGHNPKGLSVRLKCYGLEVGGFEVCGQM